MAFTINMDLLNKAREDNGMTVAPITEQISYVAPAPEEDVVVDIFGDSTLSSDFSVSGLDTINTPETTGAIAPIDTGFGAFGIDTTMSLDEMPQDFLADPAQYAADRKAEWEAKRAADTRPDYIKNKPTTYEEHQAAMKWRLENKKLMPHERTELIHRLNGGGMGRDKQVWDLTQRLDNMTAVEKAQNPQLVQDIRQAIWQLDNNLSKTASAAGKSDAIKYGVPLTMLAGDIASGGMLSAGKNITTGIVEGDIGKIAEGVVSAGLSINAKDIKTMKEAADAAAIAGDWAKAAELSREIEQLDTINTVAKTGKAVATGNYGTALLSGAPLIGVDPVGSVTETVFGQDATFDSGFDGQNYKFGGGFDVSAASKGIVDFGGELVDTGSVEDALTSGLMAYAREGGSLPDVSIPSLEDSGIDISFETPQVIKDIYEDYVRPIDKTILQPTKEIITDVGEAVYEAQKPVGQAIADVTEAAYEAQKPIGQAIDDYIIDPIDQAIRNIEAPDLNLDINLPDIPSVDIGLPDINVPEFDINLDGLDTDFNVDGLDLNFDAPEFESLNVDVPSLDLPSLDLNLTKAEKQELDNLPPEMKMMVASIMTNATLLELTPQQRKDYLAELLRSMQQ